MHPDEAALLNAVAAAPDDDLPRLVYADWLDEHGRGVRADFIRSQVELHRLEGWFRQFTTQSERREHGPQFGRRVSFLCERLKGLFTNHHAEATGIPSDFAFRWGMGVERGFLASFWARVAELDSLPDVLTALGGPLPDVAVAGVGSQLTQELDRFSGEAGWSFVTYLALSDRPEHSGELPALSPAQLGRLAVAPLTRLTKFDFYSCGLTDDHARVLAERFTLPSLRILDLSGSHLTADGVRVLGQARWWADLHEIDLTSTSPVGAVVNALREAPIPGLRSLRLRSRLYVSVWETTRIRDELTALYPQADIDMN